MWTYRPVGGRGRRAGGAALSQNFCWAARVMSDVGLGRGGGTVGTTVRATASPPEVGVGTGLGSAVGSCVGGTRVGGTAVGCTDVGSGVGCTTVTVGWIAAGGASQLTIKTPHTHATATRTITAAHIVQDLCRPPRLTKRPALSDKRATL